MTLAYQEVKKKYVRKKVHKKKNAGLIYWNLKLMDFLDHTHFSTNDALKIVSQTICYRFQFLLWIQNVENLFHFSSLSGLMIVELKKILEK